MENEKCPNCGAPMPALEKTFIDSVKVICEYCGTAYVIDPEFKKISVAKKVATGFYDKHLKDKRTEEQKKKDEKFVKKIGIGGAILWIILLVWAFFF